MKKNSLVFNKISFIIVAAYGGTTNGTRQYCKLPFIYQGNSQANCLRTDPPSSPTGQTIREPWCSLTSNFDTDRQWGFCELGITDSTIFDICRSQSQVLRCPPGYVIDIITADYAAKPDGNIGTGACVYDKNDCFQNDAITVQTTCAGKPSCTVYHFVRTLTSCQNRPSAYFHIDYNCLPNDAPEITTYDLCNPSSSPQNDTRRGFIISPNFPNTQSNIDCTFNLQTMKPNQDIYLYTLDMDLNSAPLLGQGCTKDRLLVSADNNVMEMCGRQYTNFLVSTCHGSISFQLIRSSDAKGRGVKFYFEFRDRSPTDTCPPLITTSARPPTTPTSQKPTTEPVRPVYFPDPSPRVIKTLCYPDISSLFGVNNFQCERDYVMVIHRAFYGKGSRCAYTPGDCTTEADLVYRTCSGKQACSVSFLNTVPLPECNNAIANYLFVEYQCLPTPTIAPINLDLCTSQIDSVSGISGVLKSPSYPSYTQTQCGSVTLSYNVSDLVIYMYVLDLNIGSPDPNTGNCTNDYLSLSYQCNNQMYNERLCGTRSTELLFSTCSPTDQIFASYNLLSTDSQSLRGFALLYHLLPKSTLPITTTMPPRTTTTSTAIAGIGPVSIPTQLSSVCVQQSITVRCPADYGLVMHKVQLGVSKTSSCSYSSNDCFEDRTHLYNLCGGKTSCSIFPPLIAMTSCNNSKSNYLYIEHQCIPLRPKFDLNICSPTTVPLMIDGGAIISSLNYTSTFQQCRVQLQSKPLVGSQVHKAFKIFILTLDLPMRGTIREQGAQCSDNDPLIEIDDPESGVTRLCGNSHTRYLLETCSNTVEIRYKNVNIGTSTIKNKGFQIYMESIENNKCRPTPGPITETPPFVITNKVACGLSNGRERVDIRCTNGFGLIFLQSYQFVTNQPDKCDVTQQACFYPSEQPQAQCASQQSCSYVHSMPAIPTQTLCQNRPADSTEFYYQCLPMIPSSQFRKYTFCTDKETTTDMGFIETTGYPRSYQYGTQQCSLRILLPNNSDGKKYSVYLYIMELSLRDTSTVNPASDPACIDSIKYSDGDTLYSLCGKYDQPILKYDSNNKELNLTLNIQSIVPPSEWNEWHGARLFFIVGDQPLPNPPGTTTSRPPTVSTTTKDPTVTEPTTQPGPKSGNGGVIAGVIIGLLAVIAVVIGFIYYRRRAAARLSQSPTVRYDTDMITVDATQTNGANLKRATSIPKGSFDKPSTFVSPFFKKSETNEKEETEDTKNA